MPVINIEVVKPINSSAKKEILKTIHEGSAKILQIPGNSCHLRWIEISSDDYFCVTDKPENHIYVEIKLFPGRSIETKRALYQFIFTTLKDYGLDTDGLMIALNEISKENWGMHGGIPCSELVLGYKVEV